MRELIVPLTVGRSPKAPTTAIYFSHPKTLTESLAATLHNSTGKAGTWLSQDRTEDRAAQDGEDRGGEA